MGDTIYINTEKKAVWMPTSSASNKLFKRLSEKLNKVDPTLSEYIIKELFSLGISSEIVNLDAVEFRYLAEVAEVVVKEYLDTSIAELDLSRDDQYTTLLEKWRFAVLFGEFLALLRLDERNISKGKSTRFICGEAITEIPHWLSDHFIAYSLFYPQIVQDLDYSAIRRFLLGLFGKDIVDISHNLPVAEAMMFCYLNNCVKGFATFYSDKDKGPISLSDELSSQTYHFGSFLKIQFLKDPLIKECGDDLISD